MIKNSDHIAVDQYAYMWKERQCDVTCRPADLTRKDYDLDVVIDNISIAVEVKSLQNPGPVPDTVGETEIKRIQTTVGAARKQLPKDRPAICALRDEGGWAASLQCMRAAMFGNHLLTIPLTAGAKLEFGPSQRNTLFNYSKNTRISAITVLSISYIDHKSFNVTLVAYPNPWSSKRLNFKLLRKLSMAVWIPECEMFDTELAEKAEQFNISTFELYNAACRTHIQPYLLSDEISLL